MSETFVSKLRAAALSEQLCVVGKTISLGHQEVAGEESSVAALLEEFAADDHDDLRCTAWMASGAYLLGFRSQANFDRVAQALWKACSRAEPTELHELLDALFLVSARLQPDLLEAVADHTETLVTTGGYVTNPYVADYLPWLGKALRPRSKALAVTLACARLARFPSVSKVTLDEIGRQQPTFLSLLELAPVRLELERESGLLLAGTVQKTFTPYLMMDPEMRRRNAARAAELDAGWTLACVIGQALGSGVPPDEMVDRQVLEPHHRIICGFRTEDRGDYLGWLGELDRAAEEASSHGDDDIAGATSVWIAAALVGLAGKDERELKNLLGKFIHRPIHPGLRSVIHRYVQTMPG